MSDLLFAYGFLKRAYHGDPETKTPPMEVEYLGEGTYTGMIYLIDPYPGVKFDPSQRYLVNGEIFRLKEPEKMLRVLDQYERSLPLCTINPEYERVLRLISTQKGKLKCWVYEYLGTPDENTQILSGRF